MGLKASALFGDENVVLADIRKCGSAAHVHCVAQLGNYSVHIDLEALLALGVDEGNDGTADEYRVRAETDGLEHVNAAAYAAVNKDLDLALDCLRDSRQDLRRCRGAALNSAAVV